MPKLGRSILAPVLPQQSAELNGTKSTVSGTHGFCLHSQCTKVRILIQATPSLGVRAMRKKKSRHRTSYKKVNFNIYKQ